jgi:hypothetical protein
MNNNHIVINDWDTFKEWKTKSNQLAAAIGDTDKITVTLESTIVDELLKLQSNNIDENRIKDIVGAMIGSSTENGIDIVYNAAQNHLTFTVIGGSGSGGSANGFSGIFDSVEGIDSLYAYWQQNGGDANGNTDIDAFFQDIVVGPTGTTGINGVQGMDADDGIFRMALQVYYRTEHTQATPPNIPDTNNGSIFDLLGSGPSAFTPPTEWSTTTPLPLSSDPAEITLEKLWVSTTIIESLHTYNQSKEYQLGDRVIFNNNTYEYTLDPVAGTQLTLDISSNYAAIPPDYTEDTSLIYSSDPGITPGFYTSFYNNYRISINGYNFTELQPVGNGLNGSYWNLVEVEIGGTNVSIGTKLYNIPDWSSPVRQDLAGDGNDGKSSARINVYTLSPDKNTTPISPIGGVYTFTGEGALTGIAAGAGDAAGREWVTNYKDATLPGGTTTYENDRDQGVLFYATVNFSAEGPTGTAYHTDDGTATGTAIDWGMVLRSGTDGENSTNFQILRLYKRLTDVEAGVEVHPINGVGSTPLPVRFNFDTDQLEFSYTAGGTVWHRWPQTPKDLVRLEAPTTGHGSASTFYSAADFDATARAGGLPSSDYSIATNENRLITQARITAGGDFAGIDPKYIGYYLGSPKDIIDETGSWYSQMLTSTDAKSHDHNLYVIESSASSIIKETDNVDTTLAWFPDNIFPDAKHTENGYNGVDGVEGQTIKEISLWTRTLLGAAEPTIVSPNTFYEFSEIDTNGNSVDTNIIHDIPTAGNWFISSRNNLNSDNTFSTDNSGSLWVDDDPHYKATSNAIYPKAWSVWESYSIGRYVVYYGRTYECIQATTHDRDDRAIEQYENPSILSASWTEVTVSGKSGVYSRIIPTASWDISAEVVGNQGPAGDDGSKFYSGVGAPTIQLVGDLNPDGTQRYSFIAPSTLVGTIVRRGDQYVDSLNGEIWEFLVDAGDAALTNAVSLWEMDIKGKEYDWIYRTWHLPSTEGQASSANSDLAVAAANAELLTARQLTQTRTPSEPNPLPIIDPNANNSTVGSDDVWVTEMPAYDPSKYIILGTNISYHRGTSLPGKAVWDSITNSVDASACDVYSSTESYKTGNSVSHNSTAYVALTSSIGTVPGTDPNTWYAFGKNFLAYGNSIDLAGKVGDSERWFYGHVDPTIGDIATYGICADSLNAQGQSEPIACTVSNTAERLDYVNGSMYIRTQPEEESAYTLNVDETTNPPTITWVQTIQSLRGNDGDQTMTLYWSTPELADAALPIKPANVVSGDGNPSPKNVETNNSAGDYYEGWQKDPLLPATAEGYYTYSITAYKDNGDTSGDGGGTWFFSGVSTTGSSVWHLSHTDDPNSHTFTRPVTDGDFYVQKASNGVTETIWTYQRDTQSWEVLVEEMAGTSWYDGVGNPNNNAFSGIGRVDDHYLDTSASESVWKKVNNAGVLSWEDTGRTLEGAEGGSLEFAFTQASVNKTAVPAPAGTYTINDTTFGTWNSEGETDTWRTTPLAVIATGKKVWCSMGKTEPGSINITTWTTPTPLTGDVGQTGPYGVSSVILHKISVSEPSVPQDFQIGDTLPVDGWTNNPGSSIPAGSRDWIATGTTDPDATDPTKYVFTGAVPASGTDGEQGDTGAEGLRQATGYVYYQNTSTSNPGTPSLTSFNWVTGKFSGISGNWSHDAPAIQPNSSGDAQYWSMYYSISRNAGATTDNNVQYGTVRTTTHFSGLVTFSNASSQIGPNSGNSLGYAATGDWDGDVAGATSGMLTSSNFNTNVTTIDGGKITTGSIDCARLGSGTSTFGVHKFSLDSSGAAAIMGGGYSAVLHVESKADLVAPMWARNSVGGYALGAATMGNGSGTGAAGYFVNTPSTTDNTWPCSSEATICSRLNGIAGKINIINNDILHFYAGHNGAGADIGFLAQYNIASSSVSSQQACGVYVSTSDAGTALAATTWDGLRTYGGNIRTYNGNIHTGTGTVQTFTAAHVSLINKSQSIEIGDILIDQSVIGITHISETVTELVKSSVLNQKAAIGVFNGEIKDHTNILKGDGPALLIEDYPLTEDELADLEEGTIPTARSRIKDEFSHYMDTHNIVAINAVGEGAVNVCGENGDFEAGDLIVTSSTPGKGMKQDDDIVRSYTVAKVREAVTFSDPTEVKLVACVYLCG